MSSIGVSSPFHFVLLTLLFENIFDMHCRLSRYQVSRKGPVTHQITWLEVLVSRFLLSRNRDFIFNFRYYLGLLSRNWNVSFIWEKRVAQIWCFPRPLGFFFALPVCQFVCLSLSLWSHMKSNWFLLLFAFVMTGHHKLIFVITKNSFIQTAG